MNHLVDPNAGRIAVVVPNWNGADELKPCLDSLLAQSIRATVIVVDNGSTDGSRGILDQYSDDIEVILHDTNRGYAGGVNPGFQWAIDHNYEFVAAFNNDAIADKSWLVCLASCLAANKNLGVVTSKILSADGSHIDSTGDYYTNWGLPYPRGRGEPNNTTYDKQTTIFGASGGASLYRVDALQRVGLLDEDYFAYYEDVDLSFRLQLAGWKVAYVPLAVVHHATGTTSSKLKGFTTYQTMKNLPMLLIKNVPRRYLWRVVWRFMLAEKLFLLRAIARGQGWAALRGITKSLILLPTNLSKRRNIQSSRSVNDDYIWSLIVHDLPPNAYNLRRLRAGWWKLLRKV